MVEPLSTAATTGTLASMGLEPISFAVGMLGNIVSRHIDPADEAWAARFLNKFRVKQQNGDLPPNHDVEAACLAALKNTLHCLAQAIDLEIDRSKNFRDVWARKYDHRGNVRSWSERWNSDHGRWFNEFEKLIDSKNELKEFSFPIHTAADLNQAVRSVNDEGLYQALRDGILDWARKRISKGTEPTQFEEMVQDGWAIELDEATANLSVYKIWCLFFQDEIKKNEKAFKILTVDWLSSIDDKLSRPNIETPLLVEGLQKQLGDQQKRLVELCDGVSELAVETRGMSLQLGVLLPFVVKFREEVGIEFQTLRTYLHGIEQKLDQSLEKSDEILQRLDRPSAAAVPHTWPAPRLQLPDAAVAGKLYGRKAELKELAEALRSRKNVAVVGPAGYGKTALAAEAVMDVVGNSKESLPSSPYPDGVLFLNLYGHQSQSESLWHSMANDIAGTDYRPTEPARDRVTEALSGREVLVIVEGGEQADGKDGRVELNQLLSVLSSENRSLLLTRNKSQAGAHQPVELDKPLSDKEAGWLFDRLTNKKVPDDIRTRVLELLQGHPLAITWAGRLLGWGNQNPSVLTDEWESDPSRNLSDPNSNDARHTLEWLFERSVGSLDNDARRALEAAGLLAQELFTEDSIHEAIDGLDDGSGRAAVAQLINHGLLRQSLEQPAYCQFTHALGYQFARNEAGSETELRRRLANWIHDKLTSSLAVGSNTTDDSDKLLQHASALLRTDHDQQLWIPLVVRWL